MMDELADDDDDDDDDDILLLIHDDDDVAFAFALLGCWRAWIF
jgi:hypothetical protein